MIVLNLPLSITDSGLKRECIETVGRPKFIYMHVSDARTGLFSGLAVIEFSDESVASKICQTGIMSRSARIVTQEEFDSLTRGDWPMLDYGPPCGIFKQSISDNSTRQLTPQPTVQPAWQQNLQQSRPSNPWQK